jgi:hypothetical protein
VKWAERVALFGADALWLWKSSVTKKNDARLVSFLEVDQWQSWSPISTMPVIGIGWVHALFPSRPTSSLDEFQEGHRIS